MTGASPSPMARAEQRARRLYPRSKGFRGAYAAGAAAALAGRTAAACPYPERQSKTWGNAWRLAWMRGHQSARTIDDEG